MKRRPGPDVVQALVPVNFSLFIKVWSAGALACVDYELNGGHSPVRGQVCGTRTLACVVWLLPITNVLRNKGNELKLKHKG